MGFLLTYKNKHTLKDQSKAYIATKFIGFSVTGKGRATEQYGIDASKQNIPVNCGIYAPDDLVFVSINGGGYGTRINFYKTLAEIDLVLQAGASIITDTASNAHRNYNNHAFGESGLRIHLRESYRYIEEHEVKESCYTIWKLATSYNQLSYLNKLFLDNELSKSWVSWHHNKTYQLGERKHSLNKYFIFNEQNINRIEAINKIVALKSHLAYLKAEKFEKYVLKEIESADTFISDYEIEFEVSLFSEKKYGDIEEMLGNPFFSFIPLLWHFSKKESIDVVLKGLVHDNHNEYQHFEDHPLKHQFQ